MQELDDKSLLREYVERNSQEAFGTIVGRHINKVYSVALRHTRNPHQAEEITQAVFVILAQKANKLLQHPVLAGWLYQTARLAAVTFIRSEIRRARREQEAHMQTLLNENEPEIWPQIAPLLDAAMAGLSEMDRHAILLRFFDGKSMKEVGIALGVSEDTTKMRVNRAVEKLRLFFTKRGVVVSGTILTAAISANSATAAPITLAKASTAVALAKGATASASISTLINATLKIMAWTKAKTSLALAAGLVLTGGTAAFLAHSASLASIDGTFRSVIFKHKYEAFAKRFEGTWQGKMAILMNSAGWTQSRRVVVKIVSYNGVYRALVDELDDGLKNVLVPAMTLDKLAINFTTDSFSYHGVFHKDATEIRGVWRSPLGAYLLVLTRTNAPDTAPAPLAKQDFSPRPDSDLQGVWTTVLNNNSVAQTVYLKIAEASDGTLRGECDSAGKSPLIPFPVTGLSCKNAQVHFAVWPIGGSFTGSLSHDHSTLTGQWKWSRPFTATKTARVTWTRAKPDDEKLALQTGRNFDFSSDAELEGHWGGTFPPLFGSALNLTLNIASLSDGKLSATLDSPDQSLFELPVDVVQSKPPRVKLEVKSAHASFGGRLEGGRLSGTWSFYDATAPIVFERSKP
jgi:RNA polymerase sigma factor (sigma-70 family)